MNKICNKFSIFLICAILNVTILCIMLYELFYVTPDKVLFYTPYVIILNTLIFAYIWLRKYKDKFESFLIFCCFACMNFSFIFLAPYAVDRSLSTFIFFYAVKHNGFHENSVSSKYMNDFYRRRLKDGVNGNFLVKKDNIYYPTIRSKLYYSLMYPIGVSTNSLGNYQLFSNEVNRNAGDIDE